METDSIKLPTFSEARLSGAVRFQGAPCKRGHSGERYTNGRQCVSCVAEARGRTVTHRNRSKNNIALAAASDLTTYVPEKPCKLGHQLRFTLSNNCVECDKLARERHKEARRQRRIEKEYGLSLEAHLKLYEDQGRACKICSCVCPEFSKMHVDHCHETGKVRGLLCGKCNQGLGLFHHSIALLNRAIGYVRGAT